MKELTKAEEQVMQILWELNSGFVKDIIEKFPEPKPAYTTVSTIIRILERKGFAGHEDMGSTYKYFPIISKEDYASEFMNGFVKDYFGNSFKSLVSFFSQKEKITVAELEEIQKFLDKNKEQGND